MESAVVRISIGAVAGIVLVAGLARVGVVDSRSSPVASVIRPVVTPPTPTPSLAPTPTPSLAPTPSVAATQTIPTPAATATDSPAALLSDAIPPFVTSPFVPAVIPANVKTDLSDRLPVFDEITTLADPEDSKFQTLAQFVAIFPAADRPSEKAALTSEGLQGVYYDVGASVTGDRIYEVTLMRFATSAGAANHLSHFVTRPANGEDLVGIASSVPGSHEFLGHTVNKAGAVDVHYLAVGRYFAIVWTVSTVGDKGARAQAKTLALAVQDSLR